MTRSVELHDRFTGWLAARPPGPADDPPRDLALHAAGCQTCLRSASAIDLLAAIDVGAAASPPLRAEPTRDQPFGFVKAVRYVTAVASLLLVAGSVAAGSSWLGERRSADSASPAPTLAEGILAGVPSPNVGASPDSKPSASPSDRASASAEPSRSPADEMTAPPFAILQPVYPPIAPAAPTAEPSADPSLAAEPTPAPTPTSEPPPTPTSEPTPTPTPGPDDCADGIDNDVDGAVDAADADCVATGDESGVLP